MAAIKVKKPTKAPSKKLKAGKKKPLNKWLILGGVAAVAIIGVAIVRFSSAAKWYSLKRSNQPGKIDRLTTSLVTPISIKKGYKYRFCVRGISSGASTTLRLSLTKVNHPYRDNVALSTKKYSGPSAVHCSAIFNATANYSMGAKIEYAAGSSIIVQSYSIDQLR